MIKAIIVDDEIQGRKLLRTLIQTHCPEIEIIDELADLPNAVKAIRKLKPELVFLDIEMPGHSGLEIADFFDDQEMHFSIIFTTAYAEYALQGYKLAAIDYLLKPIEVSELQQAIARFKNKRIKEGALDSIASNPSTETIAIPVGQSIKFFELNNISHLKAINSYTEIHFLDESKILVSRTLKNFEDALAQFSFMKRCHKSYIVNRKYVVDYVKSDGGYLIMHNKLKIPISTEKVQEFLSGAVFIKR